MSKFHCGSDDCNHAPYDEGTCECACSRCRDTRLDAYVAEQAAARAEGAKRDAAKVIVELTLRFEVEISDPRYTATDLREALGRRANDTRDGRSDFHAEMLRAAAESLLESAASDVRGYRASSSCAKLPPESSLGQRAYALEERLPPVMKRVYPVFEVGVKAGNPVKHSADALKFLTAWSST